MQSSLVKFKGRTEENGQRLFWGRASLDGAPFRGQAAPLLRDEEYEERAVKIADPHAEEFDIRDPGQKAKYLEVLDGIANGWYQLVFIQRFHEGTKHYIEWNQYYMQDGSPEPFMTGMPSMPSGFGG